MNVVEEKWQNSPLGNTAVQLPSILHLHTGHLKSQTTDDRIAGEHCVRNFDKQNRAAVRLQLPEDLSVDAQEFLHAVYEDLTAINEILTLHD